MRIILADDHMQALWALKTALQKKTEFDVIGEVTNAEDLLKMTRTNSPDLVLVDWKLPDGSIEDLITELHNTQPRPIVVVMSDKPEYGRMMLNAGADGFLSKSNEPDWLLETLQKFEKRTKKKKVE
jgi:DNA-binding NarL/FixJ family response regulator